MLLSKQFAPEQYCFAPLLKVERSVSDRFLRRSESSMNTFIRAEFATESRFGKRSFQIKREPCKLHNGQGFYSHWERFGTISAPQQNINSCSHCTGATFETEQKPIRYSVNIALKAIYSTSWCRLVLIKDKAETSYLHCYYFNYLHFFTSDVLFMTSLFLSHPLHAGVTLLCNRPLESLVPAIFQPPKKFCMPPHI